MKIPFTQRHIKNTTAFIGFLILLLVVAIVFRYLTPVTRRTIESLPLPKIPSNPLFTSLPGNVQIKEEFTPPSIAKKVPVYSVAMKKVELQAYVSLFKLTEQLSQQSYASMDGSTTLTQDLTTGKILYTKTTREHVDISQFLTINTEKEVAKATSFIQDTLLLKGYMPDRDHVTYLSLDSDGDYLDTSSEQDAKVIAIPFYYSSNGMLTFFENQFTSPIKVYVNSAHAVIKASFTPYQITQKETFEVDSVSPSKALGELYNNVVVGLYRDDGERITSQDIKELTITEAAVEYRLDSKSNTILPMYRFSGKALTKQNEAAQVVFLLPATQTQ